MYMYPPKELGRPYNTLLELNKHLLEKMSETMTLQLLARPIDGVGGRRSTKICIICATTRTLCKVIDMAVDPFRHQLSKMMVCESIASISCTVVYIILKHNIVACKSTELVVRLATHRLYLKDQIPFIADMWGNKVELYCTSERYSVPVP